MPTSEIWTPDIYFVNLQSSEELIYESTVQIQGDGGVLLHRQISGGFGCIQFVKAFPFVVNDCGVQVAAAGKTTYVRLGALPADVAFSIAGGPDDFDTPTVTGVYLKSLGGKDAVTFEFQAVHVIDFAEYAFILPAFVLNIVSFSTFYLPGNDDRTALGVTSVLAQMVLQIEARVATSFSWLDMFLTLSLAFQVTSFAASIKARRTANEVQDGWRFDVSYCGHSDRNDEASENLAQRLVLFFLGSHKAFPEDRFGRRFQVPLFCILSLGWCFLPTSGDMNISKHPSYGTGALLFKLSSIPLSIIALAYVMLGCMHCGALGGVPARCGVKQKAKTEENPTPPPQSESACV